MYHLKVNWVICFITLILFQSCNILNPCSLDLTVSISEDEQYFNEDFIKIELNYSVDKDAFEELVMIKMDNQLTSIKFDWDTDKIVYVSPKTNWKYGYNYILTIDGNVRTLKDGSFSVSEKRHFMYGEKNEIFLLQSSPSEILLSTTDSLIFSFNKAVNHSSFISGFSISPYLDYDICFSDDNKSVSITPKSLWPINTFYTWIISDDVVSSDQYVIKKEYKGVINSITDLELPELTTVCPVTLGDSKFTPLKNMSLSTLCDNQAIYFEFSKKMDFESIQKGISFEPSIKGCFYERDSDGKEYVFQPYENYTLKTKYHLKVSDSCKDVNNLELYDAKDYYFYSSNDYLKVTSIKIDSSAVTDSVELSSETDSTEVKLAEDKSLITLTILFSQEIKNKIDCESNISLTMLFPFSQSPEKQSCVWSSNSSLTLTYEGLRAEANKQYFYKITIKGTSSGILSKSGDFMEENKCVIFNTVL